jgi:hypothetical protein
VRVPRVIRAGQKTTDTTLEGRGRDDYTYVAILKDQRNAVEYTLREEYSKYGYRDFSSWLKNLIGSYLKDWEKKHHILGPEEYAVQYVSGGGSDFGKPYSTKHQKCDCDCHPAYEILKRVKNNRIRDQELINSVESLEQKEQQQAKSK